MLYRQHHELRAVSGKVCNSCYLMLIMLLSTEIRCVVMILMYTISWDCPRYDVSLLL